MISGVPAGQAPLNDTPYSSPQPTPDQPSAATPATSPQDVDTIVQISPQAQQLALADATAEGRDWNSLMDELDRRVLQNQKQWRQQKKPKTLLDYIEESDRRGRGMRQEAAERKRQQLGNWMPMIAVGNEAGAGIDAVAKLTAAAVSKAAASGKQDAEPATAVTAQAKEHDAATGVAGAGEELKTQLLSAMKELTLGAGYIRRQLEMLRSPPHQHHRDHKSVDVNQLDVRFRDRNGNPDLSKMLGAVFSEQIKDKTQD